MHLDLPGLCCYTSWGATCASLLVDGKTALPVQSSANVICFMGWFNGFIAFTLQLELRRLNELLLNLGGIYYTRL